MTDGTAYLLRKHKHMNTKITERGWIGHCIVGYCCHFRRNTLVEVGDKKAVVSTVGQYAQDRLNPHKIIQIGYLRWYETMAFMAEFDGQYWDADVEKEIYFDVLEAESHNETYAQAAERYPEGIDNAANGMHEKAIMEVIDILNGDGKE